MNLVLVDRFVEVGTTVRSGESYEDYYQHRPVLGSPKRRDYAPTFVEVYKKSL